jgi:uncharacterized membrane protein
MPTRAHKLLSHIISQRLGADSPNRYPALTNIAIGWVVLITGSLSEAAFAVLLTSFHSNRKIRYEAISNQMFVKLMVRGLDFAETVVNAGSSGYIGKDEVQEFFCETDGTVAWNVLVEGLVPLFIDYYFNSEKRDQAQTDIFAGVALATAALAYDYAVIETNKDFKTINCP